LGRLTKRNFEKLEVKQEKTAPSEKKEGRLNGALEFERDMLPAITFW